MGTIAEIKAKGEDRTGISGTDYDARWNVAIQRAIQEIGVVNFEFMYVPDGSISITTGVKGYDLPSDFQELDEDNVYIGANKLIRGSKEDIFFQPPENSGEPQRYRVFGVNSSGLQKIYVAYPLSDSSYTVNFGYWLKMPTYALDETPLISSVYSDTPIVSLAVHLFYRMVDEYQKADIALAEFLGDMRIMESKKDYVGLSYDELFQQRTQQVAQLEEEKK